VRKIPPHKHAASDIVETEDDYLLPYLRSPRDPSKIDRTVIEGPQPLMEGTAFPIDPDDRQLFKLTQDITGYYKGVYRYDLWADKWVRISIVHLFGTSFPSTENLVVGDTFYHITEDKHYYWNGTDWVFDATKSHVQLTDVGPDDHHTKFVSGDHAVIEHLASMLNQALQPYNSNITFARKSGSEHNAITYTAGEIFFQDTTTRSISPAGELTALPVGYNFIYFKLDSASLFSTTSHSEAVSSGRGLLAIIIVVSASDPDKPCAIQPFYAKGLNITADTMAVTLLSAICAHLGNVDVADGDVLIGDDGIKIFGETLKFYDINEVLRGSVFGVTTGCLSIYTPGWILLNPSSDGIKANTGPFFPGTDAGQALGKSGVSPSRWKYYTPRSTLASRPAASVDTLGLIWATRETGEAERFWLCGVNAASGYEWFELGGGNGVNPYTEKPQKVYPLAQGALEIQSGNSVWGWGSWYELVPANTITSDFIIVGVYINPGNISWNRYFDMQWGKGAAASETPIVTVTGNSAEETLAGIVYRHLFALGFPIKVAANSRIAVRVCDGRADMCHYYVKVAYIEFPL